MLSPPANILEGLEQEAADAVKLLEVRVSGLPADAVAAEHPESILSDDAFAATLASSIAAQRSRLGFSGDKETMDTFVASPVPSGCLWGCV